MKEEYYEKSEVDLVLAKLYDFCDKSIEMLNLEEDRYGKNTDMICTKSCCIVWSIPLAGAKTSRNFNDYYTLFLDQC